MKPVLYKKNLLAIVYDADRIPEPDAQLLDAGYWQQLGAVLDIAQGRGTTLILETEFGPAVLKRYRRGGAPANVSRDAYFYTGIERSRPFREFDILRRMSKYGLPVPTPLAASCERSWVTYRGGLLMEQIEGTRTLAERVESGTTDPALWSEIGRCIGRFHKAGVEHADLNARNILLNEQSGKVSLLDFDRCTFRPGDRVSGLRSLARLKRSLEKFWPDNSGSRIDDSWSFLVDAYRD